MLDLRAEHLAIVRGILAHHLPGREVRVFGSRAHGPAKPFSDLDLVVMGEQPVPDSVRSAVLEAFDESDLPFRVDLVVWAETPASLRDTITRTSVSIAVPPAKESAHV
jgi:type I restriction enzyme S subunit